MVLEVAFSIIPINPLEEVVSFFSWGSGSTGLEILMPKERMLLSGVTVMVPLKFNFHWLKLDRNQRAKMPISISYRG